MFIDCLILNITPYGPKDDNGIGKNSRIQYIPLNKDRLKDTEKSKGYYIDYCVLYDSQNNCYFQNLTSDDILRPCRITLDSDSLKYGKIANIEFVD